MNDKSFFEYLGIADAERIHSQFFAWMFSSDCKAMDEIQRKKLLTNIFDLVSLERIEAIHTEWKNIDIVVETELDVLIIENKLKSSQHSEQLNRYRNACETLFPNKTKRFYFLTLISEASEDQLKWKNITYADILNAMKEIHFIPNHKHSVIVAEYRIFLDRLVSVVTDFAAHPATYDMVFRHGKKRKEDKIDYAYDNDNHRFIASNQLETILQKAFLASFAGKLENIESLITETRGDALIDFPLNIEIDLASKKYYTLIQLQQSTIKFAFSINKKDYSKSEKIWITNVVPFMEALKLANGFGYKSLNLPQSRAYISLSKKMSSDYWQMDPAALLTFLKQELENGKAMTKHLISLMS